MQPHRTWSVVEIVACPLSIPTGPDTPGVGLTTFGSAHVSLMHLVDPQEVNGAIHGPEQPWATMPRRGPSPWESGPVWQLRDPAGARLVRLVTLDWPILKGFQGVS